MLKNLKISTKIILPIMVIATIVLSAASIYSYFFSVESLKEGINLHLETAVTSRAHHIDTFLNEQKENITGIGAGIGESGYFSLSENSPEYLKNTQEIRARLQGNLHSDFHELFILDSKGVVLISTIKTNEGIDKSKDDYFILGQKEAYLKDAYFSRTSRENSIAASSPLTDNSGKFVGIVVARIKLDTINAIAQDKTGLGETGEIYLINQAGYAITPLLFEQDTFLKFKPKSHNAQNCLKEDETTTHPTHTPHQDEHAGHEAVITFTDYRGVPILGAHHPSHQINWCVLAEINESEVLIPAKELLKFSIIRILIVLSIFFIITSLLAKMISKPIKDLHHGTEIIERGDLDHKVSQDSKDEIGQLSRAFDKMTAAIKQSRAEIDQKVKEQTQEITERGKSLDDQRLAILNVLEDVDEEKQIATREKEKVSTILQSIGDGVLVVDVNRRVLIFNQAAEQISGFNAEELFGKQYDSSLKFINEKDGKPTSSFIDDAISSGQVKEMANHVALIHKNGDQVPVADSAAPFKNKDSKVVGCIVVFKDVTKEREVDKMKTEFISLASHQLRTPLSAMKWFLEMLLGGDMGKMTKEQQEQVENINQSNERMIDLVNALLNVSRIESGRLSIDPKPTNICELAKQAIKELESQSVDKSITIDCQTLKELTINIDPKLIGEVYQNFIGNAIKYTPSKGKIDVTIEKNNDNIVSKITDTGIGIPKEQQKRIFEKFFRADNVLKLETDGTGLGLYLAKKIIEASGGKIGFESIPDKGSTFWFSLPLSGSKAHKGEVKISANLARKKPEDTPKQS
jgi:PAS domain S-box-containing protein